LDAVGTAPVTIMATVTCRAACHQQFIVDMQ
jgi:hypothetical protein